MQYAGLILLTYANLTVTRVVICMNTITDNRQRKKLILVYHDWGRKDLCASPLWKARFQYVEKMEGRPSRQRKHYEKNHPLFHS